MNDTLNELILDEDQLENVRNISSILNQYSFCIDTSKAGAGKTRMCCYICKEKNIKNIIVVTPTLNFIGSKAVLNLLFFIRTAKLKKTIKQIQTYLLKIILIIKITI